MNVSDLIKLLEPYKDLKVSKNYTIDVVGDKLTLKQVRRTTKTKADIMAEVVRKIENKEHTYNFRELKNIHIILGSLHMPLSIFATSSVMHIQQDFK